MSIRQCLKDLIPHPLINLIVYVESNPSMKWELEALSEAIKCARKANLNVHEGFPKKMTDSAYKVLNYDLRILLDPSEYSETANSERIQLNQKGM